MNVSQSSCIGVLYSVNIKPSNMLRNYAPQGRYLLSLMFLVAISPKIFGFENHRPASSISVSHPSPTFIDCPGDTMTLLDIAVNTACGSYSITWRSEEDSMLLHLFPTDVINPQVIFSDKTVRYTIIVTDDCTNDKDSLSIDFGPSLSAIAGQAIGLCADMTAKLGDSAIPEVTYQWNPVEGLSAANVADPVVSYTGALERIYTLKVQDTSGCTATDSVSVRFFPLPVPAFVADTVCEGTSMTFTNLTPDIPEVVTWHWNFNDGSPVSEVRHPVKTWAGAGTFQVNLTATTADGCVASRIQPVEVASIPVISGVIKADPNDCNSNDGRIVITASATHLVYPGLEYSIDGGNTWFFSRTFNGLSPGNYQIVVRNGGVCSKNGNLVTLHGPPSPVINAVLKTNPSDCNLKNGSILIFAGGGTGSLLYSIDGINWNANSAFQGLGAGSYPVLVRNADGTCRVTNGTTILSEPTAPVISFIQPIDPSDCGAFDGSIKVTSIGGSSSHEYSFDGGNQWSTDNHAVNLPQGIYEIKVRNADGTCVVTGGGMELHDPGAPRINEILPLHPSDCGKTDGSIEIDASPGTGAIEYSIDNGSTWHNNQLFQNLGEATFQVKLRNTDGTCVVNAGNVFLQEPEPPTAIIQASENPTDCGVDDGRIIIAATGGSGAYRYSVDGGIIWSANDTISNLGGAEYLVKVANADGTCVTEVGFAVLQSPVPPSNATFTTADPTKCSGKDGVITITAEGAMALEYSIDGGFTWQGHSNFNGLKEDTYELMVRNADATCAVAISTLELIAPESIEITEISTTDVTDCGLTDGTIRVVTEYAGPALLEFSIDGGQTWSGSEQFDNLDGGDYPIQVRTSDGTCEWIGQTVTLFAPATPTIVDLMAINPTDCGKANGKIILLATGYADFEVSIDSGLTYIPQTIFTKLAAGDYQVMIRNTDGTCQNSLGDIHLTEPVSPVIEFVSVTNPSDCQATDGHLSIQLQQSPMAMHCSIDGGKTWQQQDEFTGLGQGDYQIMVRNADKSCQLSGPLVALRSAGHELNIEVNELQPNCGASDGSIELVVSGQNSDLEYSIDGGNNWKTYTTFNKLAAGQYHLKVRETASGCVTDGGYYQLVETGLPEYLGHTLADPSHCLSADGFIEIQATGVLGAVQYSVDGGLSWQGSSVFPGLSSGNYSIMIRYTNGACVVAGEEVVLEAPGAPMIGGISKTDPTCLDSNGQITIQASTTGIGLEYSIDGGTTWQAEHLFTGLTSGNYAIKIKNADGSCITQGGMLSLRNQPVPQIGQAGFDNPDCFSNDGQIEIQLATVLPGITQYSIDGGATWQNSPLFDHLPQGTYPIKVRNMSEGDWCVAEGDVIALTKPSPPSLSMSLAHPNDCEIANGRISGNANGQFPVEYSLDSIQWQADRIFNGLAAGTYVLHVRYENGSCVVKSNPLQLNAPEQPQILNFESQQPDCFGQGGMIRVEATASSGTLEYSIDGGLSWSPDSIFYDVMPGTYDALVRYDNGTCSVPVATISLEQPAQPALIEVKKTMPGCGQPDGILVIEAQLGNEPASLLEYSIEGSAPGSSRDWQPSKRFENLPAGNYRVKLRRTDAPCEVIAGVHRLEAPEMPVILSKDALSPDDCEVSNGFIQILATGRVGIPENGLEYSIDGGNTWSGESLFENLPAGNYPLRVRFDDGTCMVQGGMIMLTEPGIIELNQMMVAYPNCHDSDGKIELLATGDGHLPVQYSIDGGVNWQASGVFSNLPEGTYDIALRYEDGTCVKMDTVVYLYPENLPMLDSYVDVSPSGCTATDGMLSLQASGIGIIEYSLDGTNWQTSGMFAGLREGTYSISLRYADGTCETVANQVELSALHAFSFQNIQTENTTDCNVADGSIDISVNSTSAVEYSLDGLTWQAGSRFENLAPGSYHPHVRLIDFNCVKESDPVTVGAPDPIFFGNLSTSSVRDCNGQDGMIQVAINSPGTYQYSADGGQTWSNQSIFTGLAKGDYFIYVRKSDGRCETAYPANPVRVLAPDLPLLTYQRIQPSCHRRDGSITASAAISSNPNQAALEYALNNGAWQSGNTFNGLGKGTFLLKTRLAGTNCETQTTVQLDWPTDCPPCEVVFDETTLEFEEATLQNPLCIPIPLLKTLDYNLILNGDAVSNEGGCDADSVYYYGYVPLVTLGGTDGPFLLDSWKINNIDYTGTFQTLDDLVTMMNVWDAGSQWRHDPQTYSLIGGSSGRSYGNMLLTHVRTNRSVTLMTNRVADYQGIRMTITRPGLHELVALHEDGGCSDTIFIKINPKPLPVAQHLYRKLSQGLTLEICDWLPDLGKQPDELVICGDPANGTLRLGNLSCALYTPESGFAGYDTYCVLTCFTENSVTTCDTAFVHMAVEPRVDTVFLLIEPGSSVDTCLQAQVQIDATGNVSNTCGGNGVSFSATPGDEKCMTFFANSAFSGTTQLCLVHCDGASGPLGPLCDTTVVRIRVAERCNTEIFGIDTLTVNGLNGRADACLPIPLYEVGNYKLSINGIDYQGNIEECNVDSVHSYSYFALPGAGNSGPYRLDSWMVNSDVFSGTFIDIQAMVDQMNLWDPSGEWELLPALFGIVGTNDQTQYGPLVVTHLGLNLTVPMMPNFGSLARGSQIELFGEGTQLLIAEDKTGKCVDLLHLVLNNRVVTTQRDTFYYNVFEDSLLTNRCLPTNELLSQAMQVSFCKSPANGQLNFTSLNCFQYRPAAGFIGVEEVCVIICDDLGICDTSVLIIEVRPVIVCDPVFSVSILAVETDWCDGFGQVCLPVAPIEYASHRLFVNGTLYAGSTNGCDFDTILSYNLFVLPGGGLQGPYRLNSWKAGAQTFSGLFSGAQELADSIRVWDPAGNWAYDPNDRTIRGGDVNTAYGPMVLVQVVSGFQVSVAPEIGIVPKGTEIRLPLGNHRLVLEHRNTGCLDTLNVQLTCPALNDVRRTVSMLVGETTDICLADLHLKFDENYIASVTRTCTPSQSVQFSYDMMNNCVRLTGLAVGQDSICYRICLQNGDCFTLTIATTVGRPCEDFLEPTELAAGVDCTQTNRLVCVKGFDRTIPFNYSLEIDGVPYDNDLVACNFDSLFSFSYFSLPAQGSAGPYRIISWTVNGNIFSGEFQDIPALLDSLNRWDPIGHWRHDPSGLSIVGGNSQNRYGTIHVIQVSTNAPATMEVNTTITPLGIGFYLSQTGNFELVFIEKSNTCRDTLQLSVTCVQSETMHLSLFVNESGRLCLPTSELPGNFSFLDNFCPDDSGELVSFDWSPGDTCITYRGIEAGVEQACIILCDDLGVCDTTYLIVTVSERPLLQLPMARPDFAFTRKGKIVIVNVLSNDRLGSLSDAFTLLDKPKHGSVVFFQDGTVQYTPNPDFCDNSVPDEFRYQLCNTAGCDTATIKVLVKCDLLKFYSAFSPNGDNNNETFQIEGIDQYPGNKLRIFDRWGTTVLSVDGYQNDWRGTWQGLDLPDGTYFYLFDDGEGGHHSGYIQIQR